nr:MAG TPA: Ash protein family protein [Caudoviricetes sp.]
MNIIYVNYKRCENNYNTFRFTKCGQICEYIYALAKSKASRGKLNLLQAHSTPKACFFMRNIRTSQELADFVLFNLIILSMVGRNRQPLAVGCLPVMAVFHPVTSYRPTVESLAVVSENLLQETTQMYQFIFAAIRRTDLTNHIVKIRITADSEQEARKPLAREFVLVLAGRINLQNTMKTDRTFLTNGNNHSLPTVKNVAMISPQSQKTIAEPRNSTYLQLAHSTPEACFFMRNIRTPKEFADFVFIHQIYKFLSMVACSGKGSPFAVFQLSQFSRPLHVTAKASKLSAVALKCLQLELLAMIYLFNAIKRTDFNNTELNIHTFPKSIIRVQAESLEQAKGLLSRDYFVINTGKIYPQTDRTLPATTSLSELPPAVDVKAESVKIHTLPKVQNVSSIESTETIHGTRNRNQCAIFLPKIPFNGYEPAGYTYHSELAVRATRGNKALSTNNAGYCMVAVDPLPHPTTVGKFYSLTRDHTMKIYPQNNRTLATFPALSVSAEMEVVHG